MADIKAQEIRLEDYRPTPFSISKTYLEFDLQSDHTLVKSELSFVRNTKAEFSDLIELDGQELELLELSVNDQPLTEAQDYKVTDNKLIFTVTPFLKTQDAFTLKCTTRIYPETNTALEGLYISGGMYCTQCEAEGFRRITYYLDRPDNLSVFTTQINADASKYPTALSNGNLESRTVENGRVIARWYDPFPKPSYLFALVAGDLLVQEDSFTTASGRQVALQIFVEKGNEHKCDHALASLKRSMKWDEDVYGREYDLDLFMIVAVDHFNMGAMENKGLNIFNSSCVLATPETATDESFARIEGIVGHEYFHNWSGNRVTCRDWFQLSLKEGFTVFRDAEFSADMGSRAVKRLEDVSFLRQHQFPEDAGPMAHPIRPSSYMEISNFYTVTIYEKGAEVVRMLHTILGAELFRKGSDLYFQTFDGQAATTDDFVWAMEQVSGKDFGQFKRWYTQAGTPELTLNVDYDASSKQLTLNASQITAPSADGSEKEPFVIPVKLALLDASGQEQPLNVAAGNDFDASQQVWLFSQHTDSLVFEGVEKDTLVSLLRDFSAPVTLKDNFTMQQRINLIGNDTNGFNRWEQVQMVFRSLVKSHVDHGELDQAAKALVAQLRDSLLSMLNDADLDKAVKAEMLQLPAESEILILYPKTDILAIADARDAIKNELYLPLIEKFESLYGELDQAERYQFEAQQVGRRKLKNQILSILCELDAKYVAELAEPQYQKADNMSDQQAALRAICNFAEVSVSDDYLGQFLTQWQSDNQVLEQWFRLQSTSDRTDVLELVKGLLTHPLFEYQNPNKLRAVVGGFCMANTRGFHNQDGSGYRFLAEQVAKVDKMNPQIAARLVSPLVKWRSYDDTRGLQMKSHLEVLSKGELSKDLFEIVSKSLA